MKGHFPEAKFAREKSSFDQSYHVISEAIEVREVLMFTDKTNERLDEEIADLLHACETYFRIREREGADVAAIFAAVVQKNRKRGYYL